MPDKMNGENNSLVRLFLKSGFMKELDLTKGSVLKTLLQFAVNTSKNGLKIYIVSWLKNMVKKTS